MVRVGYATRQRVKNAIAGGMVFFLIYYIFFAGRQERNVGYRFRLSREDCADCILLSETLNRQTPEEKGLWDIFNSFDSSPRRSRLRAFSLLSDNLGGDWGQASVDELVLEKMSGGFTNLVFKCSLTKYSAPPVVLKVMFPKLASDRHREHGIMKIIASERIGPEILAEFDGGRIEEFLEGRPLSKEDLADKELARELGARVAQMHVLNKDKSYNLNGATENQLTKVLLLYLDKVISSGNTLIPLKPTVNYTEIPGVATVGQLAQEIDKIEHYVMKNFNFPISLVYNNLFEGNVLRGEADKRLRLIDFEHSLHGHRAADIVSYLTDFLKNSHQDVGFEITEGDFAFLHSYLYKLYEDHKPEEIQKLKLTGEIEVDTKLLLREAKMYWPISNFFWALEHLVDYIEGNDQLDHEERYMNRLAAYFALKSF